MTTPPYPIELVILDLDGTVLNPLQAAAISPAVLDAVTAVQQSHIKLTIGTGRTLSLMQPYAEALNVALPVVTTQGAVVADPVSGEVYAETLMPLEAAKSVAEWVDRAGRVTVFYFTNADGSVTIYQNEMAGDDEFYNHVFGAPRHHRSSFVDLVSGSQTEPPVKFITVNDGIAEEDITEELAVKFPQLTITRTHAQLVEGTARGVNKGEGLRQLCRILQIDPKNVMAVGDNDNDIPMLEAAGFGVAMGNASAGVKAIADWVAPSIDEDGVAAALRKWVLA